MKRFLDSLIETCDNSQLVEIIVYVDDDDKQSISITEERINFKKIIGKRLGMGRYNSACLAEANGEIIILANDDIVVRTKGWDNKIRALYATSTDKILLAHLNDKEMEDTLSTFPVLSRRAIDILGEPYPEKFSGGFLDYHINDIFMRLEKLGYKRRIYLENVVFEHMHVRAGKADMDDTYGWRGKIDIGDEAFHAYREWRQEAAVALALCIENDPGAMAPPIHISKNISPMIAPLSYAFDFHLPLGWRSGLFMLFFTRYLTLLGILKGRGLLRRILSRIGMKGFTWIRHGS